MKRTTFNKHCAFRLPSSAASEVGSPYWTDDAIDAMDRAFCERMHQAIAAATLGAETRITQSPRRRGEQGRRNFKLEGFRALLRLMTIAPWSTGRGPQQPK
jgi:hypothetical protein